MLRLYWAILCSLGWHLLYFLLQLWCWTSPICCADSRFMVCLHLLPYCSCQDLAPAVHSIMIGSC